MKRNEILFLLLFAAAFVAFSATPEELAEDFVQPRLTLQVGFSYTALGLAITNAASQPLFVVGTNFLGITARVTLNSPGVYEVKRVFETNLQKNPSLPLKDLQEIAKREIFMSRILIFLEGGAMFLPLPTEYGIEWYAIPFLGFGFYFPLAVNNAFLVLHLNFPLIGGIGVVYNF